MRARALSYGVTTILAGLAVWFFFGFWGPFFFIGITIIIVGAVISLIEIARKVLPPLR